MAAATYAISANVVVCMRHVLRRFIVRGRALTPFATTSLVVAATIIALPKALIAQVLPRYDLIVLASLISQAVNAVARAASFSAVVRFDRQDPCK
jgi:hypothetical protein